jgi:hypothetical protein
MGPMGGGRGDGIYYLLDWWGKKFGVGLYLHCPNYYFYHPVLGFVNDSILPRSIFAVLFILC